MARRGRPGGAKRYDRTVRVGELLREIIADELTEADEPVLERVSITSVEVDNELQRGIVFFDSLDEDDAPVIEALESHRVALQRAIGRQARIRRTPLLEFRPDPAVRAGERIDDVLRTLDDGDDAGPGEADADADEGSDGGDGS